jgi:hypothetical protein
MDQNRLPNDDISFDRPDSAGAAVLSRRVGEHPLPAAGDTQPLPSVAPLLPAAPDGTACNHCQAPLANGQTLCRKCGFYATLNTFVEVDAESPVAPGDAVAQPKSHVEIWRSLIPAWGWALIAGVLALLAISVAARMLMPIGRPRAIWTYAQFGLGAAALVVAHVACYLFAIMHDSTLNFLDFVLKPFTIWSASFQDLPKSFKRVSLGAWGLAAAIFAVLIVGGVRYNEIVDWGKVPPKKKNKPAVAIPIDGQDSDKSMEEALDDFTKSAGVTPSDGKDGGKEQDPGDRHKKVRCLIIGFTPNRESDFDTLLLAIEENGKWRFAGVVNEGVPEEARSTLNRRMRLALRAEPVVPCDMQAFWLQPKLMCTVWYEDWNENHYLKRALFQKLEPDFVPPARRTSP